MHAGSSNRPSGPLRSLAALVALGLAACTIDHDLGSDDAPPPTGDEDGARTAGQSSARGESTTADAGAPPVRAGCVRAIDTGESFACALVDGGKVKCWGSDSRAQLGREALGPLGDWNSQGDEPGEMDALAFVDLGTGAVADAIAVGGDHVCALLKGGTVKCWGSNYAGQLGLGSDAYVWGGQPGEMGDGLEPVNLGSGERAVQIAAGGDHTCALLASKKLKCWGANAFGQLGQGDSDSRGKTKDTIGDGLHAIDLGLGRHAVRVIAGGNRTCAILDDASLKCWGSGFKGGLGSGSKESLGDDPGEMGDALSVVDLGAGRTATHLAMGGAGSCAILDNADIKCWGDNSSGRLGLGDVNHRGDAANEMGDKLPPIALGSHTRPVDISIGGMHACAVFADGRMKCWGENRGALGLGDTQDRGADRLDMGDKLPFLDLGSRARARAVSVTFALSCALLDFGDVKCWGQNLAGELGQSDSKSRGGKPSEMGDALGSVPICPRLPH